MRGATLVNADLSRADFRIGVIALPDAKQGLATVKHETCRNDADGAQFSGARLDGLNFEGGTAFRADFSDCALRGPASAVRSQGSRPVRCHHGGGQCGRDQPGRCPPD
ncbi:MAG: pentapeptide repeat-containing protein [Brevundimonas sp.]|nr:MAG: pentapeptide repeat-containing protein [Brevundimonas sp.]